MVKNPMQCSVCGTLALPGDRFCEECGSPLLTETPQVNTGCQKCGATPEQIDLEGYCSNCGFRNQLTPQSFEVRRSPQLAGISDRGFKHQNNEDYLACALIDSHKTYILVVCDGVSSSQSPEKAAKAAAETVCESLVKAIETGESDLETAMRSAVSRGQTAVSAIPYMSDLEGDYPATTIILCVVQNQTAIIGWMGDSRAYWIAGENSQQLTKDHSWLNEVVAVGKMTEAQAKRSPQAHAITQWLGADAEDDWQLSTLKFKIPGSGCLILCTDGLWNYAPLPSQISQVIGGVNKDALALSKSLVEFALRCGGHDNITVAVLSL